MSSRIGVAAPQHRPTFDGLRLVGIPAISFWNTARAWASCFFFM
jgi:hypothetical protein